MKLQLLSKGSTNAKLAKNVTETYILYMAPATLNCLGINLCPASTAGCRAACINTAGRGAFSNVQLARKRKADWYVTDKESFLAQLRLELAYVNRRGERKGQTVAVRLNGTTDIAWENDITMEKYNWLQFYDYTKLITRAVKYGDSKLPANYHLTYSASEVTTAARIAATVPFANVAVVFSGKTLPDWYLGFPVLDGDTSDERFQDVKGCIVGLKAKGKGRKTPAGSFGIVPDSHTHTGEIQYVTRHQ